MTASLCSKIDISFGNYKLPKLSQDESDTLYSLIFFTQIEMQLKFSSPGSFIEE